MPAVGIAREGIEGEKTVLGFRAEAMQAGLRGSPGHQGGGITSAAESEPERQGLANAGATEDVEPGGIHARPPQQGSGQGGGNGEHQCRVAEGHGGDFFLPAGKAARSLPPACDRGSMHNRRDRVVWGLMHMPVGPHEAGVAVGSAEPARLVHPPAVRDAPPCLEHAGRPDRIGMNRKALVDQRGDVPAPAGIQLNLREDVLVQATVAIKEFDLDRPSRAIGRRG